MFNRFVTGKQITYLIVFFFCSLLSNKINFLVWKHANCNIVSTAYKFIIDYGFNTCANIDF